MGKGGFRVAGVGRYCVIQEGAAGDSVLSSVFPFCDLCFRFVICVSVL